MPTFGWYGDDFTGATDTLATVARAGLRSMLFFAVPQEQHLARLGPLDALGIAGASRAMPPARMAAELLPVGRFFQALGVRVMQYKCCSTFDSAPEIGSLGAALETLRPFFPNALRPVVGGQPNLGRFCLFSNLFAAAGTGGEVHRLDRHPTMRAHPVTPMAEADLRRHLRPQGLETVRALHYPAYAAEPGVLERMLDELLAGGPDAVLLDVSREEDLLPIGQLLWRAAAAAPLLAIGPSSVAQALATGWPGQPAGEAVVPQPAGTTEGPVFVMVGSLSPVTRQQVAQASSYQRLTADAARLTGDAAYAAALAEEACARLRQGADVLVETEMPSAPVPPAGQVAQATARFVAQVMRGRPVRRLGIAGGDTSSLAAQALDLWGLSYLGTLAPGVTLCRGHSDDPAMDGIELMLKGGQMGPPDLLEQFRARLPAAA
jgi:uncharacterized protein YgbK (DUF1537 family)